jgi:serine O-acetyltransferase
MTLDALALQRAGHALRNRRVPLLPPLLKAAGLMMFSAVLSPETVIGAGTTVGNRGLGIAIHPRVRIGQNVRIGSSVTIGGRSGHWEVPVIEDDVVIGVGARVLGPIRVGRAAVIGANAVVIHDVPAGAVVGGVPARILSTSPQGRATPAQPS